VSRTADPLAGLVASLPSAATIIAVTDDGESPRYAPVRALAAKLALRVGGNVLFCVAPARDVSPPRSRPRLYFPSIDACRAGRPHTGTRARDLLLDEAREVAAPGLGIGVWLPSRHGPAGVAEAVMATSAVLVLVPARASRAKVLDRTLEYLASRVPAVVLSVAEDGAWHEVRALGAVQPWWNASSAARSRSTLSASSLVNGRSASTATWPSRTLHLAATSPSTSTGPAENGFLML
jgi:hypothetical protein